MRRLLLLTAAIGIATTAHVARTDACDSAKGAASHASAGCCANKTSTTTASTRPGDAAPGAVPARATASDDGATHKCPMAHAQAKGEGAKGSADCPKSKAKTAAHTGSGSPRCAHGSEATTTAVELKKSGKVVCARCELHKSDSCQSVFQASGEQGFTPLCGEGVSAELLKLTRHGELEVTIQGHVKTAENGQGSVLCVEGFSVGSI